MYSLRFPRSSIGMYIKQRMGPAARGCDDSFASRFISYCTKGVCPKGHVALSHYSEDARVEALQKSPEHCHVLQPDDQDE
jgi:hypothetical protein